MQALPGLSGQQSQEESKSGFEISPTCIDYRLQAELNRFKEIQKNPQLLLQTLFEMTKQKQQRQAEDRIDGNKVDNNKHEAIDTLVKKRNQSSLVCYICGILLQRCSMYAHLKVHNGYTCTIDQCNSVYTSMKSLRRHRLVHHLNRTSNANKGGSFWRRRIPAADQVENGKRSYICKLCGRSYRLKYTFKEHLRVHTGEKPRRCRFCYKTFRQRSALSNHLRICRYAATLSIGPN